MKDQKEAAEDAERVKDASKKAVKSGWAPSSGYNDTMMKNIGGTIAPTIATRKEEKKNTGPTPA